MLENMWYERGLVARTSNKRVSQPYSTGSNSSGKQYSIPIVPMLFKTHSDTYFVATPEGLKRGHPDESVLKLLQWMSPRRSMHLLQFENSMLTSRGLRISVTHLDGSIALCGKRGNGRANGVKTSVRDQSKPTAQLTHHTG